MNLGPDAAQVIADDDELPNAPSTLRLQESFPPELPIRCCGVTDSEIRTSPSIDSLRRTESSVPQEFQWQSAISQSAMFLSVQHVLRLVQPKTRAQLGGPFFRDWMNSIEGIHGWGDGDGPYTNYVLHPGMGGTVNFLYQQNSSARAMTFQPKSGSYWKTRLKGMAFAAAYSTQFEIGPVSEATIGNVGLKPGTSGYVDLVTTPLAGLGFAVVEDWVDSRIANDEARGLGPFKTRLLRSVLNPERSIANLLRLKSPWHRDSRLLEARRITD